MSDDTPHGDSVASKIDHLISENEDWFEKTIGRWLNEIGTTVSIAKEHRKKFRQWDPLRVYISLGEVRKTKPKFSVRFMGQEVGNVVIENDKPKLVVTQKHHGANEQYFAVHSAVGQSGGFALPPGKYDWTEKDSQKFRQDFKGIKGKQGIRAKTPEHTVESSLIKQLESRTRTDAKNRIGQIQPVKIANCPLQFPLPISGCKGRITKNYGHIDILARRRSGKGVKLSVWELKRPGVYDQVIEQAYIYSSVLLRILRSNHGETWYNLCGFSGAVPKKLRVEAVVAVSLDQESNFKNEFAQFSKNNLFTLGDDRIDLAVSYYDPITFEIMRFQQVKPKL